MATYKCTDRFTSLTGKRFEYGDKISLFDLGLLTLNEQYKFKRVYEEESPPYSGGTSTSAGSDYSSPSMPSFDYGSSDSSSSSSTDFGGGDSGGGGASGDW